VVKVAPGVDGQKILRDAATAVDPMTPLHRVRSMEQIRASRIAGKKSITVLLAAFAAVAVILAALGIYGVVAHQTAQRTREVGIRLALGAKPRNVIALVVGQSMAVVGAGIAVGLGIAVAGGRVIASFLFGTSALDPSVYAAVVAVVGLIGLGASAIPALRAAAIAPATALRYE
jgi:ABC-type antimicrobial peptide transport system permease subunit